MERPQFVNQEHLNYLDDLRDSGDTNMFGAGAYLAAVFNINKNDARAILKYWMESFGKEDR